MMAQVNAGRVRFVGRGEYNNSTQYYVFDLVSYNGNSYYAKVDTIGNLPTNTTYWQLVAEKGNIGPTGLTGNGISSIEKTSTTGLVDTYTITFTNGNTTTFDVTNGKGIDRIEKTATVGNIDTYTIYFNDNSTSTFEVANGEVTREELEEEVDRLSMIYNLFPTTSDEDTEMTLDGTGEVKLKKIGLKGNTYQESTTGKNMLGLQDGTYSDNGITAVVENGIITINGTASSYSSVRIPINLTFNANQSYSISANNKSTLGGGINDNYCCIRLSTSISDDTNTNVLFNVVNNSITITKTSDTNYVNFKIRTGSGLIYNNFVIKPQIEAGNSSTNWEPYTGGQPSPNPDYPQDIQAVSGDNTITICGKNLLDTSSMIVGDLSNDTGEEVAQTGTKHYRSGYIKVLPNTQYTFTTNYTYPSNSVTKLMEYANDKSFIKRNSSSSLNKIITFTTSSNTYYLRICMYSSTAFTDFYSLENMLTKGNDTTYEEYKGASYPINLGDIELCKIGTYQDKIAKSTGKNLFDKNSANIIQNKYLNDSGVETNDNNFSISDYIKVDANTVYSSQPFENKSACICFYNSNKTFLSSKRLTQIQPDFTTPNNCEYIRVSIWNADINILQIEKGSTATPYEPYGKVWYLNKQIGKVVLDGSENWELRSDIISVVGYKVYRNKSFDYTLLGNTDYGLSNYFKYVASGNIPNTIRFLHTSQYAIHCVISEELANDTTAFKAWLSTHNTTVYYVLATPTVTEITDSTLISQLNALEKAYSYDTQTNITQTNDDMPFILDVEAILSLKGVLN